MYYKVWFQYGDKDELDENAEYYELQAANTLIQAVEGTDGLSFKRGETVDTFGATPTTEKMEIETRVRVALDDGVSGDDGRRLLRQAIDDDALDHISEPVSG